MELTKDKIEKAVKSKEYKWFENGFYNLNIVGVRNSTTGDEITNKFDDQITVSYRCNSDLYKGDWKFHSFNCTTDSGRYWMTENIMRKEGCAILKEGQYRGSHKIRLHAGKYPALGQKKNVTVYRDNDRDGNYDRNEANIDEGLFGINIHRATSREGKTSTYVDKWSAGCQVIASNDDWKKFMAICERAKDIHGNSFSYTLIESKDIA